MLLAEQEDHLHEVIPCHSKTEILLSLPIKMAPPFAVTLDQSYVVSYVVELAGILLSQCECFPYPEYEPLEKR